MSKPHLCEKKDWQRPNKTEEWAYEQCSTLPYSRFVQYINFPWATYIDLSRRGQLERMRSLEAKLAQVPPKNTLIRATICQHIWAPDIIPWLKKLKITDLFWSHSKIGEFELEGVRIHPFPLYPVRALDKEFYGLDSQHRRDLLFSFVGAYEPELYLSPVRKWIFNLEHNKNWVIVSRGQWHFEDEVYGRQIGGKNLSEKNEQSLKNDAVYFSDVLSRSCFSLCPSGSGPNSIRFWESLGFGAIPVLLSDTLRLPGHHAEWNDAIIRIRETESDVLSLPAKLKALAKNEEKIYRMRVAGKALWKKYGLNGPKNLLGDLLSRETIAKLTLG